MTGQDGRVTAENGKPKEHDTMLNRLLFFSALGFLILGYKINDGLVFYFFAIHLLMLAVGRFFRKRERKSPPPPQVNPLPKTETARS